MLQSMGVVVLEERPFTVTRPDGLPVWIYQFKITPHSDHHRCAPPGPERDATAQRFADAVTAIWQGRVEIDRFNELVMRAGLTWQQVVCCAATQSTCGRRVFPTVSPTSRRSSTTTPPPRARWSQLFEALFDPGSSSPKSRDAQAAAAAVAADIDALVSLDTDRVLRAFASMIQATLRTNYFVTREGSARSRTCCRSSSIPR